MKIELERSTASFFRIDQSTIESHISAIILSPNLVLCCGKDGQLRLFRNRYEVSYTQKKPNPASNICSILA